MREFPPAAAVLLLESSSSGSTDSSSLFRKRASLSMELEGSLLSSLLQLLALLSSLFSPVSLERLLVVIGRELGGTMLASSPSILSISSSSSPSPATRQDTCRSTCTCTCTVYTKISDNALMHNIDAYMYIINICMYIINVSAFGGWAVYCQIKIVTYSYDNPVLNHAPLPAKQYLQTMSHMHSSPVIFYPIFQPCALAQTVYTYTTRNFSQTLLHVHTHYLVCHWVHQACPL